MNAVVTARVPVEVKKQADKKLKQIGSSTTELINAAYRYVVEHDCLPGTSSVEEIGTVSPGEKTLSQDMAEEQAALWRKRTVLKATRYDGSNFKELLDEARDEYYARFA